MDATNGTSNHVSGPKTGQTEVCPACGTRISRKEYERILQLGAAREAEITEERVALKREKEDIDRRRAEIAKEAANEEAAKWTAESKRVARDIVRLKSKATAESARAERAHKAAIERAARVLKKMQTDAARADAKAKAEIAKARAKADRDIAVRIRDAQREAEEAQRKEIDVLRTELKTVEHRRRREEQDMKKTIVVLRRKAEARDRAHLGTEGEENLVELLRDEFCGDRIEPRGKGGDVLHHVIDGGRTVGTIVYEAKNRSSWHGAYVKQTQAAMAEHRTSYGVLVTRSMPAGSSGMFIEGGVIVVEPTLVAQVVTVMRDGIVAIARMELSERDKTSKTRALVSYLRSDEFSGSMKRVATSIRQLTASLSRERSHHNGWWRTRELAYASVLREVAGIDDHVAELLRARPPNDDTTKTNDHTTKKEKA